MNRKENDMKVLLAGESWMTHSVHVKGFDSFTTSTYQEGAGPLIAALREAGHEVTYLPNHLVPNTFPNTPEALKELVAKNFAAPADARLN